eukprot:CAMPEP_0173430198 /NCGR_PEP_ID=MMETSP1357-20121228/8698_1 /TAXON_ID=77926 /ORGANISM="Hemiselmis rufescens, Strain PCC563" /LENGTH=57 /DNA_ID=CAMNT_0014394499 /DNA_START=34 /DNA_END=204 /DNA_ORIENTATION=-
MALSSFSSLPTLGSLPMYLSSSSSILSTSLAPAAAAPFFPLPLVAALPPRPSSPCPW